MMEMFLASFTAELWRKTGGPESVVDSASDREIEERITLCVSLVATRLADLQVEYASNGIEGVQITPYGVYVDTD